MTPRESESPVCRVSETTDKSRELVDFLLEDGEQTAILDALAIDTDTEDIDDVTGWGCSMSLPRPPLCQARRDIGLKKKNSKYNVPDMDLTNMKIRCVNEDFLKDGQTSSWKANVEPGTYRYICNNGIYRATKFATVGTDWVTAKRARYIEATGSVVNPEIRQAQKNLRKDLDCHFKNIENLKTESCKNNETATSASTPLFRPAHGHQKQDSEKRVTLTDEINQKAESESLPPASRPSRDPQLVKSASDLFVENFSTKISAFEKSEKENEASTSGPAPRTPYTSQKPPHPHTYRSSSRRQGDVFAADANRMVTPQADDISKDVFTVRPVTRAPDLPLGPLEKLTPQQKLIERTGGSECSSLPSQSQPDSPTYPTTSFMSAMSAFAQLHTNAHRPTVRSNPSTHRHPGNKSSSVPNLSDMDSLSSVKNALTLTNSNIERMRMGTYGKTPVKDYGRFLSTKPNAAPAATKTAFGRSVGGTNRANGLNSNPSGNNAFQKRGVFGYKTMSTSAPLQYGPGLRPHVMPASVPQVMATSIKVEDTRSCNISDAESYLSGTSLAVEAADNGAGGLRHDKGMALPEISGKRLPVTTTTQRML